GADTDHALPGSFDPGSQCPLGPFGLASGKVARDSRLVDGCRGGTTGGGGAVEAVDSVNFTVRIASIVIGQLVERSARFARDAQRTVGKSCSVPPAVPL